MKLANRIVTFLITSGFIYIVTIVQLMIGNVISISDSHLFYPQLLSAKVPVRPPSISSIQIINQLRSKMSNSFGPERRMLFPFNRLFLSMVAPRLMRFQFEMMLHSIISELVKKVVMPIMGSISGNNDDRGRPPVLSLTPQTPLQPASQAFDIKQMLAKAQNAVVQQGLSLNNAIRNNGQTSTDPLLMLNQLQGEQIGLSSNSLSPSLQYNSFATFPMTNLGQQTSQTIQQNLPQNQYFQKPTHDTLTSDGQQLNMNQMSLMSSIQSSPVSSETLFKKQNTIQSKRPKKSKNSISLASKKQTLKVMPQYQMEYMPTNNTHVEEPIEEMPKKENESNEYQLNYVDTSVPTYGNLLSAEQMNEYSIKEENESGVSHTTHNNEKTKQQISEEIERASRWNDILVNMDKYNTRRRFMLFK